jgi:hypothetical protein
MARLLTLICLSLLVFSCSTKKVAISKSVVDTRTDSVVVQKKDSVVFQQNAISIKEDINEIEIVPIDSTKPVVIEGREYFNATVKIKKNKREVVDTTKTSVAVIDYKQSEVTKEETKQDYEKSVDKKPSVMNMAWLLLIPVVIISIRFFLKK